MGAEDFKRLGSPTKANMAAIVERTDWVHTGITDYHITGRNDLCLAGTKNYVYCFEFKYGILAV